MNYKIMLLLFLPAFIYGAAFSQKKTLQIKADSVRIASDCDTAELILENRTRSVLNGVLTNKGNGITEFRKVMVKLNDSMYVIGGDTLHLNITGSAVNGSNVFYVSRKFTGIARAAVSGNTLASVKSSNESYNKQLVQAMAGSMLYAYPDPFSARNAALDAMASGKITNADIVIMEGNAYTIGSDDSTKNGSIDGQNPNNGTVADIQFPKSVLVADTSVSSIMKNKINMYFSEGSSFTYINSEYAIYCCFNNDKTAFKSGVYGLGTFSQVYGEVNRFIATFSKINNRSAFTNFHAREVVLQQWQGFFLIDYAVCNIEIENLFATDSNVFSFGIGGYGIPVGGMVSNPPKMANIKVKNCRFGKGQTPYPDSNDFWTLVTLTNNTAVEGALITIDIDNVYMKCSDAAPLFYIGTGSTLYNVKLTVNINNLIQRDGFYKYFGPEGGLLVFYGPGIAVNNSIGFNIKNADIDAPLLGQMSFRGNAINKNNCFNINAGRVQKNLSAFKGGLLKITNIGTSELGEPLVVNVNGNFKSYDNNAVINATNTWYSYPFCSRYNFSGKYEAAGAGMPVVHFYSNTGKIVALTDALLINDGIAPSIFADNTCADIDCNCCQNPQAPINIPIYIKNVHANTAPGINIQQVGETVKYDADIIHFFLN